MNIPPGTITVKIGSTLPQLFVAQPNNGYGKSAFFRKATQDEIVAGILWAEGRITKLNAQLDIALEGMPS